MEASPAISERPLRADAKRNRERILAAAKTAFAEGVNTSMEDLARRAGVGVGTLYRHFPTKEALVGELLTEKFHRLLEGARASLDIEDPWEAFAGTLRRNAELMAADAAFQHALMRSDVDADWTRAAPVRAELTSTFAITVDRAKAAGVVRQDFSIDDVPMLMCGLSSTMAARSYDGAFDWRRYLELMLDGIRAQ